MTAFVPQVGNRNIQLELQQRGTRWCVECVTGRQGEPVSQDVESPLLLLTDTSEKGLRARVVDVVKRLHGQTQ